MSLDNTIAEMEKLLKNILTEEELKVLKTIVESGGKLGEE